MILPSRPTLLLFYSILFLYFTPQVKPRMETSQRAPPPHQTNGNVVNGNPFETGVFQILKGGLQKNIGCRSYGSQYGAFSSFLFCPFVYDEDATYLLLTDHPWHQPPAHGTTNTATQSPTSTQDCHWDSKHPGWPGIWAGTGYPGGGAQGL